MSSLDLVADLVEETTTTTGTGNLTLAGASGAGLRTINAAIGTNHRFSYAIGQDDQSEWETGIGYLSGATTMVRERVVASSNSNALVNLSAGTKKVRVAMLAEFMNEELGRIQALVYGVTL